MQRSRGSSWGKARPVAVHAVQLVILLWAVHQVAQLPVLNRRAALCGRRVARQQGVGTAPAAACGSTNAGRSRPPEATDGFGSNMSRWISGMDGSAATGTQVAEQPQLAAACCWQRRCCPLPAAPNPPSTPPSGTHRMLLSSCRAQRAPLLALPPRPCFAAHQGPGLLLGANNTTLGSCSTGWRRERQVPRARSGHELQGKPCSPCGCRLANWLAQKVPRCVRKCLASDSVRKQTQPRGCHLSKGILPLPCASPLANLGSV